MSSAVGLGYDRMMKPDLVAIGGVGEIRAQSAGYGIYLSPSNSSRTGLLAAAPPQAVRRGYGTSQATAMTTRAALQCAAALIASGGPFHGRDLTRTQVSLLVRALLVNASAWPLGATLEFKALKVGGLTHQAAKQEVSRHWGHGRINPLRAVESPRGGATMVGLGSVRKDGAQIFDVPLPPSLSGIKSARDMTVTVAWFSSVNPSRQLYRATKLEVESGDGTTKDSEWALSLKGKGPALNMVGRGTVWSHHLTNKNRTCPTFKANATLPIRVQAPSTVPPDEDIPFALAVSFEVGVEAGVDVFAEVRSRLGVPVRV